MAKTRRLGDWLLALSVGIACGWLFAQLIPMGSLPNRHEEGMSVADNGAGNQQLKLMKELVLDLQRLQRTASVSATTGSSLGAVEQPARQSATTSAAVSRGADSWPAYPNFCQERTREATSWDTQRWAAREHSGGVPLTDQFPETCSPEFASQQLQLYRRYLAEPAIPALGPLYCFDGQDLLASWHALSPSPDKVILDIGANKGFQVLQVYSLFSNFSTNLVWMMHHKKPGCPWYADVDKHVFPRVFAFEASPSTAGLLSELQQRLPLCNLQVINKAMSDIKGPVQFAVGEAGDEQSKVEDGAVGTTKLIEAITVDDFCDAHSLRHVDLITIDAEQHDPQIVRGMQELLRRRAVDVVVFEMSVRQELKSMVDSFDANGYSCFIIGPRILLLLSGSCYDPFYSDSIAKHHYNVLCVLRTYRHYHAFTSPLRHDKWARS